MRVLIASMPWAHYYMPSIQVGALKAYLSVHGVDAIGAHWFSEIAAWLGPQAYNELWFPHLEDGEALYGALLFPEMRRRMHKSDHLRRKAVSVRQRQSADASIEFSYSSQFLEAFDDVHQKILDRYDWSAINLIGFTLNFGQTAASLYMAREVKKRTPKCRVIFGGAEATGRLGASLVQHFDFVDYACNGEGERSLLSLSIALAEERSGAHIAQLPGVIAKSDEPEHKVVINSVAQLSSLDELPVPDFDDYFQNIDEHTACSSHEMSSCLPVEASRGCQYHCSFCALNLQWESVRARTPIAVADMLDCLAMRHKTVDFFFVDNINPVASQEIFDVVAQRKRHFRFFFELRANTPYKTLTVMRQAGLSRAQVGIEAFSSSILSKFNKRSRLIHNAQAMKNCFALGIPMASNLIVNHPKIDDDDIEESIKNIHALRGFPPPDDLAEFALQVGSPDEATSADGTIEIVGNFSLYDRVYPPFLLETLDLPRKEFALKGQAPQWSRLMDAYEAWKAAYAKVTEQIGVGRPHLAYFDGGNFLRVEDYRSGELEIVLLDNSERRIFLEIDQAHHISQIERRITEMSALEIQGVLDGLCQAELCLREGDTYLGLAIAGRRDHPWG
jgi:ribosomal peptide maturation radical SAM protein 1